MKRILITAVLIISLCTLLFAEDISITVYNQNRALIRENRTLTIDPGISTISFTDVASQIDPTSVHFKSLTSPDKLMILEQNYEYDLVSADKVMEKYIDQKIRIVMKKGEVFEGQLLSAMSGIVIKDENGRIQIVQRDGIQHFDFPELPQGLITRPTLVWKLENQGPRQHDTEISYLTSGMKWHAEYVSVVGAQDQHCDMAGWVSIDNRSGATYMNAKLKLVAGDVHLVEQDRIRRAGKGILSVTAAAPSPQFEEKAFFEYHLYTLNRRATVKDNQIKQISLFPTTRVKTEKIYIFEGLKDDQKIRVHLEFKNSKKEGLGLPLPKGLIRVYKEDQDGAFEFIGEDQIDHTPTDEKVRIYLGNAFDLVGKRIQKESKKISTRSREETIEISLRNHKKETVLITVVEHFYGDWEITQKSHPLSKKDARTAEFQIKVPADDETKLVFTVLTKW